MVAWPGLVRGRALGFAGDDMPLASASNRISGEISNATKIVAPNQGGSRRYLEMYISR